MEKEKIMRMLIDWNFWGDYRDESIKRKEYKELLKDYIKTKEITVVKGVRRSGKSTIVLQFLNELIEKGENKKNILIINFEDPRMTNPNLELLDKIYEIYLEELEPEADQYVVLDEVQEIKGWEKFVRFLHEAKKVNVIVTGSSSKLLSEEYSTLLSGRHVDIEIYPLSFKEFLNFKGIEIKKDIDKIKFRNKIKKLLEEYLEFGGFPKICLVDENEKKIILDSYFSDIMIKDVQKRYNIRETNKLEQLAKYYLTNISSLHSFNKIKEFIDLSLDSIERFSNYFSIARLLFFIPRFSYSLKPQILNPKKVYAIDTGLRNRIAFKFKEDVGKIMENVVLIELMRKKREIYYWKNIQQEEVDFVVKNKKIKELIQVCWDISKEETKRREIRALIKASDELKCNNLLVITGEKEGEETINKKRIKYMPLWKWLLE